MSDEDSLHGPNCECSDSDDDSDDEPRAKRQRTSSPEPSIVGRFTSGDYLYLSDSDSDKIVKAVEQAELARKFQNYERLDSDTDWENYEEDDHNNDGGSQQQQQPTTPPEASDQEEEGEESDHSIVSNGPRVQTPREAGQIQFSDNSSSISSDFFADADIDVDSGGSNWLISSPLNNGSGSSVHWSNTPSPRGADLNPDDRVYDLEFEVASVSESELNQNPIEDANSSSGLDERVDMHLPLMSGVNGSGVVEEENDRDADNSEDSESSVKSEKSHHGLSSDSELSDKDKWPCHQCKTMTSAISRYCLRCFRTRRNWLPKRPKSRKAKRNKITSVNNNVMIIHGSDERSSDEENQVAAQLLNHRFNHPAIPDRPSVISTSVIVPSQGTNHPGSNKSLILTLPDLQDSVVPSSASALPPSSFQDNTPPTSNPNSQLSFLSHSSLDGSLLKSSDSFTTPKSILQLNTKLHTITSSQSKDNMLKELESTNDNSNNNNTTNTDNSLQEEFSPSSSSSLAIDTSPPSAQPPPLSQSSRSVKSISETPMCTVCCLREKDAAFVHNKIAHHCCCFTCADKILKKTGKCPICRERILRVVKIISV